jgi:signal transduction histidine kinase/DNA-binding response OmpR family regulator
MQFPCAAAVTSVNGLFLSVNDEFLQVLGGDAVHWENQALASALPLPSRIFLETHLWPLLRKSGDLREVSLNLLTKDQRLIPVLVNARLGHHGDVECVFWVFFVSQQRSRFEAELIKARGLAQTLAADLAKAHVFLERAGRMSGVGAWRLELEKGQVDWSDETCRIHEMPLGHRPTPDEAIGFYAPTEQLVIRQAVAQCVAEGVPWDLELKMQTASGRCIWVRAVGEVEYEDQVNRLKPVRLIGAFQDITARYTAEQALRSAKLAADVASAAKSSFLANMSHEIRTPLNAVIGVTHLLADSGLNEDQQQLVTKAQIAGRSLLGIVNDVLDLAKIEAGEMALEALMFRPDELLAELQAVYEPQALAKSVSLEVRVEPEALVWLLGDSTRLRQMLTNLIGNALKFTSVGSIKVQVGLVERSELRVRLRASVRDTGIGIAPEVQAQLFQPFAQADASTTRRFGGTGLGLSIVRKLSQLMGGEVGLNSEAGRGSEFWIEVPMALPSHEETTAAANDKLEVAVVDDNVNDRLALAAITRALGWRVTVFESGADLVHQMKRRQQNAEPLPDALLLDWQMPGMDGLQTLKTLAIALGPERLPTALMISAFERETIDSADHEHLADQVLAKPIAASVLFNAVNSGIARHTGSTAKVIDSTRLDTALGRWLPGVRVLVADDSDINLEVARRLLDREGAQVKTCINGREAVDLLRQAPDGFDVVLMDVQMPVMDGLEAARCVRGELGLTDLPIVALTAGALTQERTRTMAAGMNDFQSKPIDPQMLVRTIRRLVEDRRGEALPLQALEQRTARAQAKSKAWPPLAGVDVAAAAQRMGGDWALFASILRRLPSEFADLMAPTQAEPDAAGRAALVAQAHKLRGSAGTLGATEIHRLASEAEGALRTPGTPVQPLLQRMAQALVDLREAAAPLLAAEAGSRADSLAHVNAAPLTKAQRDELADLLRQNDLAAMGLIEELAPALHASLGASVAEQLSAAAQALDFEQAHQLLAP